MGDLTKSVGFVLLWALQPKSVGLPAKPVRPFLHVHLKLINRKAQMKKNIYDYA